MNGDCRLYMGILMLLLSATMYFLGKKLFK